MGPAEPITIMERSSSLDSIPNKGSLPSTPQLGAKIAVQASFDDSGTTGPDVIYKVHDVPSWRLSLILGLQHNLAMFSGAISVPYLLSSKLCTAEDSAAQTILISTTFFVSGIATFLQTVIGNRLPIIQGPSLSFLVPVIAILGQTKYGNCPNSTILSNFTKQEKDDLWMTQMREVQGAIIVASFVEVLVGLTGLIGFLMQWITPLAIVPTITLIGLTLFNEAARQSSGHWGIAALTIILLIVFSQYLGNVNVPLPSYDKNEKKCGIRWFPFFKIFPVTLTIVIAWGVCALLTVTGALPEDSKARSDLRLNAIDDAEWIRVPYPGQFGTPDISIGPVLGVIAGVMASVVESVGDYYACARLAGAPPPPVHAVNRGIFMEGIGCVIAGFFGTGSGLTSFSQNIGVIGITKVGSRRVIQYAAIIIALCGIVGKLGAIFVAIPSPVMGGIFCVTFGIVTAVGLSNLQFVNLNSSRNLFVIGFSIFMGLCIPSWVSENREAIATGNQILDQIISILLETGMFVGGFIGCFLDNTVPGTKGERGITRWRAETMASDHDSDEVSKCYDLPFCMKALKKVRFLKFLPISPTYVSKTKISLPVLCKKRPKKTTLPATEGTFSITKI